MVARRYIGRTMTVTTNRSDGGVDFRLDLDTDRLLPGRIATGSVHLDVRRRDRGPGHRREPDRHRDVAARRTRRPTPTGHAHTETHTVSEELQRFRSCSPGRVPSPPARRASFKFELPVPPSGSGHVRGDREPADVAGRGQARRARASIPTSSRRRRPPADRAAAGRRHRRRRVRPLRRRPTLRRRRCERSIALDPVAALHRRAVRRPAVTIATGRQQAPGGPPRAAVSKSRRPSRPAERGDHAVDRPRRRRGRVRRRRRSDRVRRRAAGTWLPTIRLPHGRADAQFHVILAKAWAPDTHLVRDVAICSTTEL